MKKVASILNPCPSLGGDDGLDARTLFSYQDHADQHSPFLRLNYAAPTHYPAKFRRRKACASPLRGFDLLTLVYAGEMEQRDSLGHQGLLAPGDVQWLSAGAGLMYQACHSESFARHGGLWHMVQLWINLPAQAKSRRAPHQTLGNEQVPLVPLPKGAGQVRVIAGNYQGLSSPIQSQTAMQIWDIQIKAGHQGHFQVPEGWNTSLLVLGGELGVNEQTQARPGQVVVLDPAGQDMRLDAQSDSHLLLLSGQAIAEPVVGYGPFVMNTQQEIAQAINDFDKGDFGYVA